MNLFKKIGLLVTAAAICFGAAFFVGCSEKTSQGETESSVNEFTFEEFGNGYRVTAYKGDRAKVVIPAEYKGGSVRAIGENAFYGNEKLQSVTIPEGVSEIGENAFCGCTYLTELKINATDLETIKDGAFDDLGKSGSGIAVSFGEKVKTIPSGVCASMKKVTRVDLPEGVTKIESSAFSGCGSLTEISLPKSLTEIASSAFARCGSLKEIVLPDSVTTLGNMAFSECSALERAELGNSLTAIGIIAFEKCASLTEIKIPQSVAKIDSRAFEKSGLVKIEISEGVTEIGGGAFADCTALKSIVIPESVTEIGYGAFSRCTALESVTVGGGVEHIKRGLFEHSPALKSVTLKNGVKSIESFAGCAALKSIVIPESVTEILPYAFEGCNLEKTYYGGTESGWNAIKIDESSNGGMLNAPRYYYSENQPAEQGNYWHYVNGVVTEW